ncbi:MAG: nucleotidyltransferase [Senegalia sp. (in: firmicutes)]|uniref:nucleotidyltransferase n=1 Tax=Senegalia sp. (in: firmicutes) TaxID=1924098 RepID=UPI003F99F5F2
MKIVGLVTEYNPFHNGHKYHLERSKYETNCDYSIAIMSGNFVQRGEPAICDKWSRAKMAIDSGVDLVIELPTLYSTMSAEFFSYGAIKILDSLNSIDFISFGSETNDLKKLNSISKILAFEPLEFKYSLKKYLNEGNVFPKARSLALKEILKDKDLDKIINNPNNILAIEYMKSLIKLKSTIKAHSIKRISSNYNDKNLTGEISSATAIRNLLIKNNNINRDISLALPSSSEFYLNDYLSKYNIFNDICNFNNILIYKLRTIDKDYLSSFLDVEIGLENRIIEAANKYDDIIDIIEAIKTKRYTYTRIKRILIHILLDINYNKNDILNLPAYVRVLASNKKGFKILKKIKNNSNLPIINKVSDFNSSNNNKMLDLDIMASNVYFMGIKNSSNIKNNFDFYISPYIKT